MVRNSPVRSKENFLVFGSPQILEEDIEEVVDSLRSAWPGTGPKVARFEDQFKEYKGSSHAMAVNSCTAAMHLSLLAAGIGPGDEVITTALTFCSTVNVVIHVGATPVLADVDPVTMNIDPVDLERQITPKTRAIMPVHFAGRPCEMDSIMRIAKRHDLKVIEDCAHAIETEYHEQKAGTFGDFGCFSFYSTKNVVTGEGGMVVTENAEDADFVRVSRLHGMSKDAWKRFSDEGYRHYQVAELGFKYNMMDLQAALGIHQLGRVEDNWKRRQNIWNYYQRELADTPLVLPAEDEPGTRHAYHLYTVLVDENRAGISRDGFLDRMTEEGIGAGVHYLSIPEHPYYQENYGWRPEDYPNAMTIGRQTVSIPLSAKMIDEDAEDVVTAIRKVVNS